MRLFRKLNSKLPLFRRVNLCLWASWAHGNQNMQLIKKMLLDTCCCYLFAQQKSCPSPVMRQVKKIASVEKQRASNKSSRRFHNNGEGPYPGWKRLLAHSHLMSIRIYEDNMLNMKLRWWCEGHKEWVVWQHKILDTTHLLWSCRSKFHVYLLTI